MDKKDDDSQNKSITKKQIKISRVKNIILDGATELFLKDNYENVAMNDIADSVALSRATLYNYFRTKEIIYFDIGTRYGQKLIKKLQKLKDPKKSGLEVLISIFKILLEDTIKNPLIPQILENLYLKLNDLNLLNHFFITAVNKNNSTEVKVSIDSLDRHIMGFTNIFITYRRILNSEFQRGKIDGSIKTSLDDLEFFSMMNIIYLGSGGFFRSFQFPLKQYGMTENKIVKLILELIKSQLT